MKAKLLTLVLLIGIQHSLLKAGDKHAAILVQLESLNKFWKGKQLNGPVAISQTTFTEVEIIQLHLRLVEAELRSRPQSHLSAEQRQLRSRSLDVLHAYQTRGVFPKNLYHTERTPYFVDDFGTACAVGQLIIASGNGDLASKIRKENNNGYIHELADQYPSIGKWAAEHGFTLDELAWIQPCYCTAIYPGTVNVTCHGGFDGYFVPDAISLKAKGMQYYRWNNSAWDAMMMMCGGCNFPAGSYKCTVTDSADVAHDFFAVLTQPDAINISLASKVVNCTATLVAGASGGSPPYTYLWSDNTVGNKAVMACGSPYNVKVTDQNGCVAYHVFTVSAVTDIQESGSSGTRIYPSVVSEDLHISAGDEYREGSGMVNVTNIAGRKVAQFVLTGRDHTWSVAGLQDGIYFLEITDGARIHIEKFIKITP